MITTCPGCWMIVWRGGRHKRTWCSTHCQRRRTAYDNRLFVAELAWIAGTDNWDNIAARLGYSSRDNLARKLDRLGENGWANKVARNDLPHVQQRAA